MQLEVGNKCKCSILFETSKNMCVDDGFCYWCEWTNRQVLQIQNVSSSNTFSFFRILWAIDRYWYDTGKICLKEASRRKALLTAFNQDSSSFFYDRWVRWDRTKTKSENKCSCLLLPPQQQQLPTCNLPSTPFYRLLCPTSLIHLHSTNFKWRPFYAKVWVNCALDARRYARFHVGSAVIHLVPFAPIHSVCMSQSLLLLMFRQLRLVLLLWVKRSVNVKHLYGY